MVVHGQLVEPADSLSDLYDVFLLDIVKDTRQNLLTMIYMGHSDLQMVWVHWQCQTEQVSKVVWCISELFFSVRVGGRRVLGG